MEPPYRADNLIKAPLEHYMGRLQEADPQEIAQRLDIPYEDGKFTLEILGQKKTITFPTFDDEGWDDKGRILFGRYLLEGKKAGVFTDFATYRELPWGETYNEKFQQRCIMRMAGTYGFRPEVFKRACEGLGAKSLPGSGIGYEFKFMPGLYIRFILWEGDDEFPAAAQILFSNNFQDAFAGEDRVYCCERILGEMKKFH